MNNNRCVVCNEIIPEGRMVCSSCEQVEMKMGLILQSLSATDEEVDKAYNFMEGNNNVREACNKKSSI